MKPLDRDELDRLVRQLEAESYGLVLEFVPDRDKAADALIDAFARVAPFFSRAGIDQLKRKLIGALRRTVSHDGWSSENSAATAAVTVPDGLHVRLVDAVEEHQSDEVLGRRKVVLIGIAATILVIVGSAVCIVRISSLNAARPIIKESNPVPGAHEVAVQGRFWVRFSKPPSGKPSISLQPSDGVFDPVSWDGQTALVTYDGLHLATSYTLTVRADYRTSYQDTGHFVQQWRFTTEGYPTLVGVDPADGATGTFRKGEITVEFNHRPPITPVVSIEPAVGNLEPGAWTGSKFVLSYSGLRPLTTYRVTVVVNYGTPKVNIHRSWSFSTEMGPPPAGLPVVWYLPGGRPNPPDTSLQRLVALDWNGNMVGTSYIEPNLARQTWDGSLIGTDAGGFISAAGTTIAAGGIYGVIADDSRTTCTLGGKTADFGWLQVGPIGGSLRKVIFLNGDQNWGVQSCSVKTNRAVLVQGQMSGVASIRVVTLDSGRLLYQHSYSTYPDSVIASRDCRYTAEQYPTINTDGNVVSWETVIRRLSDGAIVARLPNQFVLSFSWNDLLVVTDGAPGTNHHEVNVLNWQTGKVVWRVDTAGGTGGAQPTFAFAEPNGSHVGVAIGSNPSGNDVDQLWIVSSDGQAKQVLSSLFFSPLMSSY